MQHCFQRGREKERAGRKSAAPFVSPPHPYAPGRCGYAITHFASIANLGFQTTGLEKLKQLSSRGLIGRAFRNMAGVRGMRVGSVGGDALTKPNVIASLPR